MKRMKKEILLAGGMLFLVCLLLAPMRTNAARNSWVTKKNERYYYDENGTLVRSRLKKIGKRKYFFDRKGRMVKNTMKVVRGKRYYFGRNGKAKTGWVTWQGKKYYFDEEGCGVKGLYQIGESQYFFSDQGMMQTGWQFFEKKKAYFYQKTGKMAVNRTIDGVKLDKNGYAKLTRKDKVKKEAEEKAAGILKKITTNGMSRAQQLRAAFDYVSSRSNFSYVTWRAFEVYDGWEYDYAIEFYDKKAGNCYNFACGFAVLAKVIGYEDCRVVRGRIRGSRDGAPDGLTRHACVRINGLYYDPELQFAGTSPGIYGMSAAPLPQILGISKV